MFSLVHEIERPIAHVPVTLEHVRDEVELVFPAAVFRRFRDPLRCVGVRSQSPHPPTCRRGRHTFCLYHPHALLDESDLLRLQLPQLLRLLEGLPVHVLELVALEVAPMGKECMAAFLELLDIHAELTVFAGTIARLVIRSIWVPCHLLEEGKGVYLLIMGACPSVSILGRDRDFVEQHEDRQIYSQPLLGRTHVLLQPHEHAFHQLRQYPRVLDAVKLGIDHFRQ